MGVATSTSSIDPHSRFPCDFIFLVTVLLNGTCHLMSICIKVCLYLMSQKVLINYNQSPFLYFCFLFIKAFVNKLLTECFLDVKSEDLEHICLLIYNLLLMSNYFFRSKFYMPRLKKLTNMGNMDT